MIHNVSAKIGVVAKKKVGVGEVADRPASALEERPRYADEEKRREEKIPPRRDFPCFA